MVLTLVTALPMFACFFWLVFFVCRLAGRRMDGINTAGNIVSMLFFLASTVLYMCHFLYFTGHGSRLFEIVYFTANLSVFPLFYLYLLRLTQDHSRYAKYLYWLFVPSAVAAVLLTLATVFGWSGFYGGVRTAVRLCFACQVLFVWIDGHWLLRDFTNRLDDIYSDDRSWELRPVTRLLHLLGVISVIAIMLNLLGKEWFAGRLIVVVPALMMAVLLYAVGYVVAQIRVVIEDNADADDRMGVLSSDDLHSQRQGGGDHAEEEHVMALKRQLEDYMRAEKPYTNPAFTIYDLARALNTNRSYVSNLINHQYGMNFSAFVSGYRVEHAKEILSQGTFATNKEALNAAMVESGFLSEPSFYRLFKQKTGKTPSAFRADCLNSRQS